MVDIVKQIIKYYLEFQKIPTKNELDIKDLSLLEKRWNLFVTLYKNGNIVGNSGNVVEIENDIVNELIKNTIFALGDKRFPDLASEDIEKINIRIDIMTSRVLLGWKMMMDKDGKQVPNPNYKNIKDINPVKSWVLAIKKDYEKLAVILPNISSTLTSGSDLLDVLSRKLDEEFKEDNFILYEIQTEVLSDY